MECRTCHNSIKQQYICVNCLREKIEQKRSRIDRLRKQNDERRKKAEQICGQRQRAAGMERHVRQYEYRIQELKREIQQIRDENTNERIECIQANTTNTSKDETLNEATGKLKDILREVMHKRAQIDPEDEKTLKINLEKLRKARRRTISEVFKTMSIWVEAPSDNAQRRIYIFTKFTWLPFTEGDVAEFLLECRDKGIITNNSINAAFSYIVLFVNTMAHCLSISLPHELQYATKDYDSHTTISEVVGSQIIEERISDSSEDLSASDSLTIDTKVKKHETYTVTRVEPITIRYPLFVSNNPNDLMLLGALSPLMSNNVTVNSAPTPHHEHITYHHRHHSFAVPQNFENGSSQQPTMLELFRYAIHLLNENVIALCIAQGIAVSKRSNLFVNLITMQNSGNIGAMGPFVMYNKDTSEVIQDSKQSALVLLRKDIGYNYYIDGTSGDNVTQILKIQQDLSKKSTKN